ncbi:WG repeat-containing protein [Aquimarina algicola]|uniref:WG repeat-containing protein n=2 Tax=Aquimarina algicola TaxID=2589995 RepID=A0A504IUK3_9FLAO|nr:WG repeat-containing protein [Aquimarina algicola]
MRMNIKYFDQHFAVYFFYISSAITILFPATTKAQSVNKLKKDLSIWVKEDEEKWALIDGNQNMILPTYYAYVHDTYDNMAIVEVKDSIPNAGDKHLKVIDATGKNILDIKATWAEFLKPHTTIKFKVSASKYGVLNSKGDTLVRPIYRTVEKDKFHADRFIVKSETTDTSSLVNSKGEVLIADFTSIYPMYKDRYFVITDKTKQLVATDQTSIQQDQYEVMIRPSLLLDKYFPKSIRPEVLALKEEEYFLVNVLTGERIMNNITPSFFGFTTSNKNWIPFKEGEDMGYRNLKGELLFSKKNEYDDLGYFFEGISVFTKKVTSTTAEDKNKKEVLFGIMDQKGKEIIPPTYDWIYRFYDGLAKCKKDGKYGYINKNGKVKIPVIYDEVVNHHLENDPLLRVCLNEKQENKPYYKTKCGMIDQNGDIVVPIEYSPYDMAMFGEDKEYIKVRKKYHKPNSTYIWGESGWDYGIFDKKGRAILPLSYQDIRFFESKKTIEFKN